MRYSNAQASALVFLRLGIGWHFLYEGGVKILNPKWTSKAYLLDSGGFLEGFFEWIANNPLLLNITDAANAWGLTLIGLSLIFGIFTRYSTLSAIILLSLYYLSHPAFTGIEYFFPSDGSYFIVNKTLVEIFALFVLYTFPTSLVFGILRLVKNKKTNWV